jgi:predicted nucleotidyltransferase
MMTDLLERQRAAIAAACQRHGVRRLEVFGSALRDDFDPARSDVDLLVEFVAMEGYARVDAYFGLLEDLRVVLGREVDLVMSGAVRNRFIVRDIEQTKQMLYAA